MPSGSVPRAWSRCGDCPCLWPGAVAVQGRREASRAAGYTRVAALARLRCVPTLYVRIQGQDGIYWRNPSVSPWGTIVENTFEVPYGTAPMTLSNTLLVTLAPTAVASPGLASAARSSANAGAWPPHGCVSPSGARRKSLYSRQSCITRVNSVFPCAKLAQQLRCAALATGQSASSSIGHNARTVRVICPPYPLPLRCSAHRLLRCWTPQRYSARVHPAGR